MVLDGAGEQSDPALKRAVEKVVKRETE